MVHLVLALGVAVALAGAGAWLHAGNDGRGLAEEDVLAEAVASAEAEALAPFADAMDAVAAEWAAHGEESAAVRKAVARAGIAVVRARGLIEHQVDGMLTRKRWTTGSGTLLADGRLLLIAAHQARSRARGVGHAQLVEFITHDRHVLHASLIEFADDGRVHIRSEDGSERTEMRDWALYRVHNPFEVELYALPISPHVYGELVAALGYPQALPRDVQAGLEPVTARVVVASPTAPNGQWPAALPLVAVARRESSDRRPEFVVTPPNLHGISGGPVVDRSGRVVGISRGYEFTWDADADGRRVEGPPRERLFEVTWTSCFQAAVERAAAKRTSEAEQLIDRIVAVAKGLHDPRDAPERFHLSAAECAALGLPAATAWEDAFAATERSVKKSPGDDVQVTRIWTLSHFQGKRWMDEHLPRLIELGPDALAEFRRSVDAELGPEWPFAHFARGELFDACEEHGVSVGARTLRALVESPHPKLREKGVGYLATIAHDVDGALRLAEDLEANDEDDDVRAAARSSARDLRGAIHQRDKAPLRSHD